MTSKRSIVAGISGNVLEWYDFFVYTSLSPILSKVFFPHQSNATALMITLSLFATGFLMRPLGALFFGYLGDQYGRKNALVSSILLMALATFCLAVLPLRNDVFLVTILVLLCRVLQGFSAGGELTGTMVFVVEHAPKNRSGYFGSLAFLGTFAGIFLGSLVSWLLSNCLTTPQLYHWGWRLAFIFGGLLGILGVYLRQKAHETPYFKAQKVKLKETRGEKKALLSNIVSVIGINVAPAISFWVIYTYLITGTLHGDNHLSFSYRLLINSIGLFALALSSVVWGVVSDKTSKARILISGFTLLFILSPFLFYWSFQHPTLLQMLPIIIVFSIILGMIFGPLSGFIVEANQHRWRYSTISIGYNIAASIFGGTAPVVILWLTHATQFNYVAPGYLMLAAIISLFSVLKQKSVLKESRDTNLPNYTINQQAGQSTHVEQHRKTKQMVRCCRYFLGTIICHCRNKQ